MTASVGESIEGLLDGYLESLEQRYGKNVVVPAGELRALIRVWHKSVPPPAPGAGAVEQHQDNPDDQQDEADGLYYPHPQQVADNQQNEAEHDHGMDFLTR